VIKILEIKEYLELARKAGSIVLDTRSPKEYAQGHLPTAHNLPLLDDEQRHLVGICYKEKGQEAAVELGFELVGPYFSQKIKTAKSIAPQRQVLIYCWRGGLRSNIMAWLLSTAGFDVVLLKGGYKSYRQWTHQIIAETRRYLVITGKTGSGKTELLHTLSASGAAVLDLEGLASHRGSTFGSLGQPEQSTQEQFENLIAETLSCVPNEHSVIVEDESRRIGKVLIPDAMFDQLNVASCIMLEIERPERSKRILTEYGNFENTLLFDRTFALQKRMGPEKCKQALMALHEGNKELWCDILLDYYDKTYQYTFEKTPRKIILTINGIGKDCISKILDIIKL
jgi:tRNA 2-selenouridine synthase